jgi:hypothetical protein
MDRREFVKFLALLAAGAAAMPQQVEAFTHYFETNTPLTPSGLICVDEIYIGGTASKSTVARVQVLRDEEIVLNFSLNLFGGIVRWVAAPQQMLMGVEGDLTVKIDQPESDFTGHLLYIDQVGKRWTKLLTECCTVL